MRDDSFNASTVNGSGTMRWCAPELLVLSTKPRDMGKPNNARPTMKSDTYSLAMVIIEVAFCSSAPDAVAPPYENLRYSRGIFHSAFTATARWFSCSQITSDRTSQSTNTSPLKCGPLHRSAGLKTPTNDPICQKSWRNLRLGLGKVYSHWSSRFFAC
jgi:serine/threonine protein kinase